MKTVWAKVRSDLRSSPAATIAIVLVIGFGGGLSSIAAWRRSG